HLLLHSFPTRRSSDLAKLVQLHEGLYNLARIICSKCLTHSAVSPAVCDSRLFMIFLWTCPAAALGVKWFLSHKCLKSFSNTFSKLNTTSFETRPFLKHLNVVIVQILLEHVC